MARRSARVAGRMQTMVEDGEGRRGRRRRRECGRGGDSATNTLSLPSGGRRPGARVAAHSNSINAGRRGPPGGARGCGAIRGHRFSHGDSHGLHHLSLDTLAPLSGNSPGGGRGHAPGARLCRCGVRRQAARRADAGARRSRRATGCVGMRAGEGRGGRGWGPRPAAVAPRAPTSTPASLSQAWAPACRPGGASRRQLPRPLPRPSLRASLPACPPPRGARSPRGSRPARPGPSPWSSSAASPASRGPACP